MGRFSILILYVGVTTKGLFKMPITTVVLLAMLLVGEAGGQGAEGMRLVASTVINRSVAWDKPIRDVIVQPRQHYGLTSGLYEQSSPKTQALALKIAQEALVGGIKDRTGGALYFINPRHEKPFRWCKVKTYQYKDHAFYK